MSRNPYDDFVAGLDRESPWSDDSFSPAAGCDFDEEDMAILTEGLRRRRKSAASDADKAVVATPRRRKSPKT